MTTQTLTVRQMANLLQVHSKTILRRIASGAIPRYYVMVISGKFGQRGCEYRLYPEALNAFLAPNGQEHNNSMQYLQERGLL